MNNKISPLRAIRAFCMECSNYSVYEVRHCPIEDCALYAFRFGRNPNRKLNLSPEQRKILSDRLSNSRMNQKSHATTKETATI